MGLITAKELAKQLGIAPNTVYQMAREGRIPTARIGKGRHLRFDLEAVRMTLGVDQIGVDNPAQTRKKNSIPYEEEIKGEEMEREIEDAWNRLENGLFESDNPLFFASNHDAVYDEG